MPSKKLRPCPFCGGDEIEISSEDGASRSFFRAYCDACSAAGSFSKSRAAAIRGWSVIRATGEQVKNGQAITWTISALRTRGGMDQ